MISKLVYIVLSVRYHILLIGYDNWRCILVRQLKISILTRRVIHRIAVSNQCSASERMMNSFNEIVGGVLKNIGTSKATYVGIDEKESSIEIMGYTLEFDIGVFVIENPFIVLNSDNEKVELKEIIDLKVISAYSTKSEIKLNFEVGYSLSVSMKDEDFTGPEAASYSPNKGDVIVFN